VQIIRSHSESCVSICGDMSTENDVVSRYLQNCTLAAVVVLRLKFAG
jgi:hypothetical protein